jgi:hypothetical protein
MSHTSRDRLPLFLISSKTKGVREGGRNGRMMTAHYGFQFLPAVDIAGSEML